LKNMLQMKKLYFLLILIFLVFTGCRNETGENQKTSDKEIIELDNDIKGIDEPGKDEKSSGLDKPLLDTDFKNFLQNFSRAGLPYKIEPREKLSGPKIAFELQEKFLSRAEDLDPDELRDMQAYAKYYYISNPISTTNFHAVIYARSEMGSNYYLLCTFDNQGRLISSIDFAMYQLIGAGPQAGQEFLMTGSIDKNYTIKVVSEEGIDYYQISEDGKISVK
jgi:hypothetical protein